MNILKKKLESKKTAYTLIELSIVILIISILLSGGLMVFATNLNKKAIKTTKERMDIIYQAMGEYLITHKRLPCPAPLNVSQSTSTAYGDDVASEGVCDSAGTYTSTTYPDLVYGMIPVQDLGLSSEMAQDGFGSKFSYVIHKDYTKETAYTGTDNFGTSNAANIIIKEQQSVDKEIINDAVFVIISHGYNKFGSFNANSSSQNVAPTDSAELSNFVNVITTNTAAFNNEFYVTSKNSDDFDDILFFKDKHSLVSDFNAFFTIPCKSDAPNHNDVTYSSTTMTWPNALYGQVVAANEECPLGYSGGAAKPTKRCGFNGIWEAGVVSPCVKERVTTICTGGNMAYISGTKVVHVFTTNGTFECSQDITAEIFALGGGGGGGGGGLGYNGPGVGAGGGGGQYQLLYDQTISSTTTLNIVIGAGGSSAAASHGTAGGDTIISGLGPDIRALGGNGGGYGNGTENPIASITNIGAPGGGSCGSISNPSGNKIGGYLAGGEVDGSCGGGASQDNQGGNSDSNGGGAGGAGFLYLNGLTYGSGGGGGLSGHIEKFGNIGLGGGTEAGNGALSYRNINATNGVNGRGGGGGGGGSKNGTNRIGGAGGSGVVFISFEY